MSYNLHVYPPLRPERREIRVLMLFPSSFDDPIRCELEILSLDERPQYEALSYVWSIPPGNTDIIFRGKHRAVTRNLGLALRRLRKMKDVRKIWVDALCIDQDDKAEKESQVSLMGEIYRRAAEVFIWLGDSVTLAPIDNLTIEQRPDLPWTGKAFDDLFTMVAEGPSTYIFQKFGDIEVDPEARLLEWEDDKEKLRDPGLAALWLLYTLTSGCHMNELPCFVWDDDDKMLKLSGKRFQAAFKALVDLLSLPWWTRIWVVQEAVLPPKATVVLGSLHAQWDMLAAASNFFELHLATCCSTLFNRLDSEYKNAIELCMVRIREVTTERDRYQATGSVRDAFDLIWQYRNREATDPRDMVYGLLGIASDLGGNGGITPDYSCSRHELYLRTALLIIRRTKTLRILEGIRHEEFEMPSWVPDWSATIDARLWLHERTRLRCSEYQASGGVHCSAQLGANASLLINGIYVDTVVTVCQIVGPDESGSSLAQHLQG